MNPPPTRPMATDPMPAISETRRAKIVRERISRPRESAPSRWCAPGGARISTRSWSSGAGNGSQSAKTAAANHAIGTQRRRAATIERRRARASARAIALAASTASAAMTDPGIDELVKHVDGGIDQHEHEGDDQHHPLDDEDLFLKDRVDQELADSGQCEEDFDDYGTADQTAHVDADNGDQVDRGRTQG